MLWTLPLRSILTTAKGRRGEERLTLLSLAAMCAFAYGCGSQGGTASTTPSLPTPAAPTMKNSYVGTQNPGLWSLALDDTQQSYSYQPVTYPATPNVPNQGSFSNVSGILEFGLVDGDSAGIAIEIPSRTAVLRPGDNTTAPVATVQQPACFAITGSIRFVFTGIPGAQQPSVTSATPDFIGYGTIVMSTGTDGTSWQFNDWSEYELPQTAGITPAGTIKVASNPLSFTAKCAAANGQALITADANPAFTASPTFSVNPAGYFIEDTSPAIFPPSRTDSLSWIGVAMPASPLTAATIASGNYAGFVYEPNNPTTAVATQPVAFAPTTAVSGSLTGGTYPNDDLTQVPGSQYNIALGSQDSVLNGVFPNATLTMPDSQYYCAANSQNNLGVKSGFDLNGNPTCTTAGVAIVGDPEGQYVIYFSSLDGTLGKLNSGGVGMAQAPQILQMYLYQQ